MRSRVAVPVLAALALVGCNKERIPYLGHWHGGFEVQSSTARAPTKALAMRGYLQLYRTDDKFLIEVANPIQVLDLGGTWRLLGSGRIELTVHDFRLSEPDIDKLRAMRRPFLDPQDLRAAYSRTLVLALSKNGSELDGLLVRVGPLLGTHVFRKGE